MRNPLPDVRPVWIPLGWFAGAALTALALLTMAGLGLLGQSPDDEGLRVPGAMALGFGAAGVFVGARVGAAPIVHAIGIGLFSVLVWVLVNAFLGEPTDQTAWSELGPRSALGMLALQTAATAVGARMGVRWVRPE